jgi:type I restriction enzyme S subunit
MRKYDTYKDSGVEWIGEIPSHWEIKKISYFGNVTLGKMLTPEDKGGFVLKPYLRSQNIQNESVDISDVKEMWFSEFELDKLRLWNGDLLLNEGGDVGRTCIWNDELDECYIQNSVNRIRFVEDSQKYFLYLSVLYHSVGYYDSIVNRVSIPHLTKEKLESVRFLRPPLHEQQQIVAYLDTKTALIDALLEKTQRKIELLKEKRTALINEVVTKGLNPNVEMVDSGVEWIGEIPSHWEFIPIKYITERNKDSIRTGPFGSSLKSDEFKDEGIRVYNQRSVYDEDFSKSNLFVSQDKFQELKGFEVIPQDVLITSRGTIGRMTVVPEYGEIGVLHPCLIRLRLDRKIISDRFLRFYMNQSSLFLTSVLFESNSTTIEVIYSETLSNVRFPLPPISEQQQIVSYMDEQTQLIDNTIAVEERRIELLKEYRQALIAEVVTGKRKVVTHE